MWLVWRGFSAPGGEWRLLKFSLLRNQSLNVICLMSPDEIPDEKRYREVKSRDCVGRFITFSVTKLIQIIKPLETNRDGLIFDPWLSQHAIPFMQKSVCILYVQEATFLDNKAPSLKALETHCLLKDNEIVFLGNDEWLAIHLTSKSVRTWVRTWRIESKVWSCRSLIHCRFSRDVLEENVNEVL